MAATRSATETAPWPRIDRTSSCLQAAEGNQAVPDLPADRVRQASADLGISDQGFSQSQQGRANVQISSTKAQAQNLDRMAALPAEVAGQATPVQIDWAKTKATGTDHLPVSEQQWRERQAHIVKACKASFRPAP